MGVMEGRETTEMESQTVKDMTPSQHPMPHGLEQLKKWGCTLYIPKGTKRLIGILYDSFVL